MNFFFHIHKLGDMNLSFKDSYTNSLFKPIISNGKWLFEAKFVAIAIGDSDYVKNTNEYTDEYLVKGRTTVGDTAWNKLFLTELGVYYYLSKHGTEQQRNEFLFEVLVNTKNKFDQIAESNIEILNVI